MSHRRGMLPRDHSLCHCEVGDYHNVPAVLPLLEQPAPSAAVSERMPPNRRVCANCEAVECDKFRPLACEVATPSAAKSTAAASGGGAARTTAVHAHGRPVAHNGRAQAPDNLRARVETP